MNNEFERMWNGAVLSYFEIASQHLTGGAEKNHHIPLSKREKHPAPSN